MRYLSFLLVAGFFWSCGSDSSGPEAPEFSSNVNVNEIRYQLEEVQIEGNIQYSGYKQKINNTFSFEKGRSNEEIIRKTIDDQYTLQINGKKADINVGSSGQFDSQREVNLDDGCLLTGTATAEGEAVFDRLDLVYELRVRLEGDDCPKSVTEDYLSFIDKELNGLSFDILNRLRESRSLSFEGSKEIFIRIRARGVVS